MQNWLWRYEEIQSLPRVNGTFFGVPIKGILCGPYNKELRSTVEGTFGYSSKISLVAESRGEYVIILYWDMQVLD